MTAVGSNNPDHGGSRADSAHRERNSNMREMGIEANGYITNITEGLWGIG